MGRRSSRSRPSAMDAKDGGTAAGRSRLCAGPAAANADLQLLQSLAEAAAGLLQHGEPEVRSAAPPTTGSGGDRKDGGSAWLVSLAEADGLEDRLEEGKWTALEGDLCVGRPGASG